MWYAAWLVSSLNCRGTMASIWSSGTEEEFSCGVLHIKREASLSLDSAHLTQKEDVVAEGVVSLLLKP